MEEEDELQFYVQYIHISTNNQYLRGIQVVPIITRHGVHAKF